MGCEVWGRYEDSGDTDRVEGMGRNVAYDTEDWCREKMHVKKFGEGSGFDFVVGDFVGLIG